MPASPLPDLDALVASLPGLPAQPAIQAALAAMLTAGDDGHTAMSVREVAAAAGQPAGALINLLIGCGLAARSDGGSVPDAPIIIDGDRLALRRVWLHERNLAALLTARAADDRLPALAADSAMPTAVAAALPLDPAGIARSAGGVHWQRLAACTALARGLAVVTGGPGTGKTTVAAVVVGLLAGHHRRLGLPPPQVILAAPTAKAAQRLAEAVRDELHRRSLADPGAIAALAGWTSTLHRMFRDPRVAQIDLAVIDEVSMADVATLHRALERLPATARLLLLGDPDQLASVEPGHVLGDITTLATGRLPPALIAWHAACGGAGEPVPVAAAAQHPLADVQVRLQVNWRSGAAAPLAALVAALQRPQGEDEALDRLDLPGPVQRLDLPARPQQLVERLLDDHAAWIDGVMAAPDPATALHRHESVRLLTAMRQGPWGSESLNAVWEHALWRRRGLAPDRTGHVHGRPIIILRNRPDLGLDNGTVGVVWSEGGAVVGRFPAVDGTVAIPLHRLDAWAPAWFLTVHKAQGSQGDAVDLIGPGDAGAAALHLATRELVYTGITRARSRCRVWWSRDGLRHALLRRTQREAGLAAHVARLG